MKILPVLAVLGIAFVLLVIFSAATETIHPVTHISLGLGADSLISEINAHGGRVVAAFRIRPVLDGFLLVGAYLAVCLLSWSNTQATGYLKARGHLR